MNSTAPPYGTMEPISGSVAPIYSASSSASMMLSRPSGVCHIPFFSSSGCRVMYRRFFSIMRLVAGLSISAPADRLDDGWVPKLQAAAQEISLALGYSTGQRTVLQGV